MSTKEPERTKLISIIENVLENRSDVKKSKKLIDRVAMKTVRNSPAVRILSEMETLNNHTNKIQLKLACCIELLAIVTNNIDLVSDEMDFIPGPPRRPSFPPHI